MVDLRLRILLVLLGAAVFATFVPAADAATRDPVAAAISRAFVTKQVTAVQARDLRRTWVASARATRTAPSSSRRASIRAVRAYTTRLARSGGLTGSRLQPAMLSVEATTWIMTRSRSYPRHEQEVQIPGEPLVFTYYSGRGVQMQPFETFKQGLRDINQLTPDTEAARAIADRMLELGVHRGSSLSWEYFFPFGGPWRPWTSAISQAIGTEFYDRMANLVPAEQRAPYDAAAASITRSFLRSPAAGGVGVSQGTCSYSLIDIFSIRQLIINPHLQVLLNLHRYAESAHNADAQRVYDLGLAAVVPLLPRFDTGAWSNYQPGQEAELGYHEFQSGQLVKLGKETGNPTLQAYGARFTQYTETPPKLAVSGTSWPSIIPARDGFRDAIGIRFRVDKRSKVTMVVFDAADHEVRRTSVTRGRGAGVISWNGRNSHGNVVHDGDYHGKLTITDVAGNRAYEELPGMLTVARDQLPPQLHRLATRPVGARTIMTVVATDAGSAWIDAKLRIGRTVVAHARVRAGRRIVLRIGRRASLVRRGTLVLRDSTGNQLEHPLGIVR
jgi:hypothetical protein